jgi:hypothetical protein
MYEYWMVHRCRAALFSLFHYFHIQLNRRDVKFFVNDTFNCCCARFCTMWVFISWEFLCIIIFSLHRAILCTQLVSFSTSQSRSPPASMSFIMALIHLLWWRTGSLCFQLTNKKMTLSFWIFFWWQVPHHHYSAQTMLLDANRLYKVIMEGEGKSHRHVTFWLVLETRTTSHNLYDLEGWWSNLLCIHGERFLSVKKKYCFTSPFFSWYASSNWWRFRYLVVPTCGLPLWAVCLRVLWSLPLVSISLPFLGAFFLLSLAGFHQ